MRTILPKNVKLDPMFDEKSNVELIEDIHNEVYSAHDLLLNEAKAVLDTPIDESKVVSSTALASLSNKSCAE